MSEEELVQAYLEGQMTRRVFIRRLVAMGISFGAAVSYSSILRSSPAEATTPNDFYDLYDFYCDPAHHDVVRVGALDTGFQPQSVLLTPGDRVRWVAPPSNNEPHTVTDSTGMALYDAALPPGSAFVFQFKAAGRYAYRSKLANDPGMVGTVAVQPVVEPASVPVGTPVTLAWACSAAPAGFVFDVSLKRPGVPAQRFLNGTTARLQTYLPDGGPGTYVVGARLRKLSNNKAAAFETNQFQVT